MGIKEYFEKRKKENLPLIARVNLLEHLKQLEEDGKNRETSILASADYTARIPKLRLFYVAMGTFHDGTKIGQTYGISSPYCLPHNMPYEDAFKVVSYLSEKIEREYNLEPGCEESVARVSHLLCDYGFSKVESYEKGHFHITGEYDPFRRTPVALPIANKINGVIDLFTVCGNQKLFKKSELGKRYVNWFTPNVSQEKIERIYKSLNIEHLLPNVSGDDESQL